MSMQRSFLRRQRRLIVFASRKFLYAAIALFVLMVVIGAIPGEAKELSDVVDDRLLHFTAYLVLSALVYAALAGNIYHRALCSIGLVALLGLLDETLQLLMPYRVADLSDLGFDILAASASVLVMSLFSALQNRRRIARIYDALRATPAE